MTDSRDSLQIKTEEGIREMATILISAGVIWYVVDVLMIMTALANASEVPWAPVTAFLGIVPGLMILVGCYLLTRLLRAIP